MTPYVKRIYLSGASSLRSEDTWESSMEPFVLEASGASTVSKLCVNALSLKADLSGTSNCNIVGDFSTMNLELSGASAATISGTYDEIKMKASGASKATIIGEAQGIKANCSGSSRLNGYGLKVEDARIDCSGASRATIDVNKSLDVELSGASTCHYRSENSGLFVVPSVSRASSLKKID